jgi:hypothetical protein
MPLERLPVRAGCRILEPDRLIVRSRRERITVRRERYYLDRVAMPLERLLVRTGRYIPEPDRLIVRSRYECITVRRERYYAN